MLNVLDYYENRAYSPEEQTRLNNIWLDDSLSVQERSEQALNYLLSIRTKNLTDAQKEKVHKMAQEVKAETSELTINGRFNYVDKMISVSLPATLRGSPLEFVLRTHELEHYISFLVTNDSFSGVRAKAFWDATHYQAVRNRFLNEAASMAAEWGYAKSIPSEIRELIRKDLDSGGILLFRSDKKLIEAFLDAPSKPLREYLKNEWERGRYNLENVKEEVIRTQNMGDILNHDQPISNRPGRKKFNKGLKYTATTVGVSYLILCGILEKVYKDSPTDPFCLPF